MKITSSARLIVLVLLFLSTAPLVAAELPSPFEANYEGSKFPFVAKAKIALQRFGDYYRYTMQGSVRAAFFKWTDVYDCSVLRVQGERFFPVEFAHRDSRKAERSMHSRFDWGRRLLHTRRGDGSQHDLSNLPAVAWDLMSVQVRLRADIAGAETGSEFTYDVVEKDEIRSRKLKIEAIGETEIQGLTMQVVQTETDDGRHRHQFWFAKNYSWLPVRVSVGGVALDLVSAPADAARAAAEPSDVPPTCE